MIVLARQFHRGLDGGTGERPVSNQVDRAASWVLTVNGGSSSIKFALYAPGEPPQRHVTGSINRIGLPDAVLTVTRTGGQPERHSVDVSNHVRAGSQLIQWLDQHVGFSTITAVGHRIVH